MVRDYERDIRELAQAIATLEVVFTGVAVAGLAAHPMDSIRIGRQLRELADAAVFLRDGLEPSMLDRIADRLEAGHSFAS